MKLELQQRLWVLRNFFTIYIERARDLAKADRKDEARDWLRFFRNSGILGLLSDENYGVLTEKEMVWLNETMRELQTECHPLDVPNFSTDLQAIRGHLELISAHLGIQSLSSAKNVIKANL